MQGEFNWCKAGGNPYWIQLWMRWLICINLILIDIFSGSVKVFLTDYKLFNLDMENWLLLLFF